MLVIARKHIDRGNLKAAAVLVVTSLRLPQSDFFKILLRNDNVSTAPSSLSLRGSAATVAISGQCRSKLQCSPTGRTPGRPGAGSAQKVKTPFRQGQPPLV